MPRTRSAASPPPRRSGTDRPHSVRHLTQRATKLTSSTRQTAQAVEQEQSSEATLDPKQKLILRHAEARAERHQSSFGGGGMILVVLTCLAIFVGWWVLSGWFGRSTVVAPLVPMDSASTSTVRFAPASTSTSTAATSSTERRLLLPLTPSTSTKTLK